MWNNVRSFDVTGINKNKYIKGRNIKIRYILIKDINFISNLLIRTPKRRKIVFHLEFCTKDSQNDFQIKTVI